VIDKILMVCVVIGRTDCFVALCAVNRYLRVSLSAATFCVHNQIEK